MELGEAVGQRRAEPGDLVDRRRGPGAEPGGEGRARRVQAQAPRRRRAWIARIGEGAALEERGDATLADVGETIEVADVAAADRRIVGQLGEEAAEERGPPVGEADPPALLRAAALGPVDEGHRGLGRDRYFAHSASNFAISSRASIRAWSSPRRPSAAPASRWWRAAVALA